MNIDTDNDCLGFSPDHPLAEKFDVLAYQDGLFSTLPKGFFQNWLGDASEIGHMQIGKCSGFGVGSIAKYDSNAQALRVGRFVSGGLRLRFILNGQHETRAMSTSIISFQHPDLQSPVLPQYGDSVIKNDVWIGDEVMMLGGGTIEDGCIVGARSLLPPNFTSEPYGIYVGSPARLVRFRFSEKVIEALLDLAWWDAPNLVNWLKRVNRYFLVDFTQDEGKTLALLAEVKEIKQAWLRAA
ncbi:Streptogramin A acetyltransferase [Kosakonia sp. BK9b]|uniref:hypothetical protein n=1 Tax=Kosakonia sp. TaxID=1916651 RepID=UPI00289A0FDE|nr:hypothetical protein [Kosakonia sp.]